MQQNSTEHFVSQNQMVNSHSANGTLLGPIILQTPGSVYNPVTAPVQNYYYPGSYPQGPPQIYVLPSIPDQYQHVPPSHIVAIPPPTSHTNQFSRSQIVKVPQQKPIEPRKKCPLPIIDPNTKEDIIKNLPQNVTSSLRTDAENFVPSSHQHVKSTVKESKSENVIVPKTDNLSEIRLIETVISFDNSDKEQLSFGNDENPSITASIRQIPSNLEQQLNQDEENVESHSPIRETSFSPCKKNAHQNHESHRDDPSRKRYRENYQHQNFSPDRHRKNGPRRIDRNNNNVLNVHDHRKNYSKHHDNNNTYPMSNNNSRHSGPYYTNQNNHVFRNHQQMYQKHPNQAYYNGGFPSYNNNNNNNEQKFKYVFEGPSNWNQSSKFDRKMNIVINPPLHQVDQECTAHPIKDLPNNTTNLESDTTMELKDLELDENNNEIIKEDQQQGTVEGSYTESTVDNSESSLNISWRYSTEELTEYKNSRLVLSEPPTSKGDLLDKKLKEVVWKTLFDKSYRVNDDFGDSHNSSTSTNKSSNSKRSNNSSRYENQQTQLMRSKSGPEKEMIKVNLSLQNDIKLNKAENAWKPSHVKKPHNMPDETRELDMLKKNFRSLLNKLSAENFDYLVKEINDKQQYNINTSEKLSEVVELLFEKSISEPGYASIYAKLCKNLSTVHVFNVEVSNEDGKTVNPWKIYLIHRCQREFERSTEDDQRFKSIKDQIDSTSDTEEIETLQDFYYKIRQRANGTIKFIGELYKLDMLTASIMKKCIDVLLKSITEENIERLCKLLTTVGEKLESEIGKGNSMNKYMVDLERLKNSNVITTSRIKFDIMNVIDLRASNWKPRENSRSSETKPQKLQDLQEEEEKRQKKQQYELNEFNERQNNKMHQQNIGRSKSQRICDSDGFSMQTMRHFDINKVNIPRKNDETEVTLGPPKNFFVNFNRPMMSQMMKPMPVLTAVSNSFANLSTDCDEPEQLPIIHHTRSGQNHNRNGGRRDYHHNNKGNNHSHKQIQIVPCLPKRRSPTPEPKSIPDEIENDLFMIDLTDSEAKDMKLFVEKLQQLCKGKIVFDMMKIDLKKIKITSNVLGSVYNDLFDKKSDERKELIGLITDILKEELITEIVNTEALKLSMKSIPMITCDVPYAYDYFVEYCVHFIESGFLKLSDAESICQHQENVYQKIMEKVSILKIDPNVPVNTDCKTQENDLSRDIEENSQNTVNKTKVERSLVDLMNKIQFNLKRKIKENYLEKVYSIIDKEECQDVPNFMKDLTITLLKSCVKEKGQKSLLRKKTPEISKLFPIFIRYINNDLSLQIECLDGILDFVQSNSEDGCNICNLFDLFYDNDVISMEAFKYWKERTSKSQGKYEIIKKTTSFFLKLEETDLSDDFNCTSSTIKD